MKFILALCILALYSTFVRAAQVDLKDLSIDGGVQDGKARLTIEAHIKGSPSEKDLLFATTFEHLIRLSRDNVAHAINLNIDVLQGEPRELLFTLSGDGEIQNITGEGVLDWSIRQQTNGTRTLIIRPRKSEKLTNVIATVTARHEVKTWPSPVKPLTLVPPQPALFSGFVKIESTPELDVKPADPSGVVPIEPTYLPTALSTETKDDESEPLAFRVHGSAYKIPLQVRFADPEARRVVLRDFKLTGRLGDSRASFTLTATARIKNPSGASINLLSGGVAFTDLPVHPDWRVRVTSATNAPPSFLLVFDRAGEFPIRLEFDAAVRQSDAWRHIDFRVAPSALQPLVLEGLRPDTQIEFAGGARPERAGDDFSSFLPPSGAVKLSWKESPPEVEGKLFYSANMLSQISISPGLMRQISILDFKVMQGEMNRVTLLVPRPAGTVPAITRVAGPNILAWQLEPAANQAQRLVVQFNQPQKDTFSLQVHMQTELGVFPQAVDAIQLRPEDATRFGGHFRVVNDGAVRLEVTEAAGLSQIAPEQFPETDLTKTLFASTGNQRFVFRFSGADFALRIQADNILPELSVSQVLAYHLGETELVVDAEFEIDIREAPVRELLLRVPSGYTIARLNAAGSSDYFSTDNADEPHAQLRIVYSQPISGRQVVQLRLERNAALGEAAWNLPRLEVTSAKSTRGHIGVSADAGFRITAERTQGLTEIATAFFPKKLPGIQAAFRLSEPAWQATIRVERLPQSVQADVFHLFSIGEGIGYGSSTINYVVSGAPVSTFNVELSSEYFNVEFTGKDIRNWQKTATGYTVQLHTPVTGTYTLLATYERPFRAQGDTLTFTGARPLDVQSEQGHTVIVSAYQFQVNPVNISPGLLALETAEVPAEYRLFFDAPVLAAYRYTSRPFNLQLNLSPLAQGDTLSIVVDRAALHTRISKDGEVITDARYFVKNRGNPYLRLELPAGTVLWSVTVNGATTVPVKDGAANLIPLPQRTDPNAIQVLDLKLASRSTTPRRVTAAAPLVNAPVLLADWKLDPDTGQRLVFRRGSLAPENGGLDASGFAGLVRLFSGYSAKRALEQCVLLLALVALTICAWRWASHPGTFRFSGRHLTGTVVGLVAMAIAVVAFTTLIGLAGSERQAVPRSLALVAPVQQGGANLTVEVANITDRFSFWRMLGRGWPALLAVVVWVYAFITARDWLRPFAMVFAWTLLAWTALRSPNGAAAFLFILLGFVLLLFVVPALRRLWRLPPKPVLPAEASPAGAMATLLVGGLLALSAAPCLAAPAVQPTAQSVIQEIVVNDDFASGVAEAQWQMTKGQMLPLLYEPAVLTRINYPTNTVQLVQTPVSGKRAWQLLARDDGAIGVELSFQLQVSRKDGERGFMLPTQQGLVNRLKLTLTNLDVDVVAPQAVSLEREMDGSNTVAQLVLPPVSEVWIGWKPRTRDVKREKPEFYAEIMQLYVPSAGVIEGVHQAQIRPARGELNELVFDIPANATITDVFDPSSNSVVSVWRFDPDNRKLRVTLSPAQSRPFTILVRSQIATGSLPYEQTIGLISVANAEGQLGLAGVASGAEVQLDSADAEAFSPINLEDYPQAVLQPLAGQIAGLTLRRAFRYTDALGTLTLKASAVQPDVRVDTQETLSLGEDRVLLAINLAAEITRAGIFRLSFVLPSGLDVESISGNALSHWTELKAEEGRIITLHLKGKTEGQHQFAMSLAGAGLKPVQDWSVPRFVLREAGKQRGQLLIVPEQGFRLQVRTRDGVTQLDPQKSTSLPAAYRQKGVLAFRLLHAQWLLSLDIEQVDAWVQVSGLQHVTISDAQVKIAANLQYQIENTGLKALRLRIPTNAESVRFRGEHVADFLPVQGLVADGLQTWEVKLHRRIIGGYLLHVTWVSPLPAQANSYATHGLQAADANLQRGFLTIQSSGRIQARVDALPAALQLAEWQSIPRALQQDIPAASADYTYRLVNPVWQLPLILERHEATKLLPARVTSVTLSSVVSDQGVMLTEARLELIPGDKRLLHVSLPPDAKFWFAFVNKNGVFPWREQDRLLIPLEQQSRVDKPLLVELFYSSQISSPATRSLDATLLGPKFDLPLENITWQIYLDDKWHLADWSGSLQLHEETLVAPGVAEDLNAYLQTEANFNQAKTKEAEELLTMGNSLLERGDPQQARRAFKAAYGLSTHDNAFNEDARVQLHNLKLQQALIGLNVRQSVVAGETDEQKIRGHKALNYTQQQAKQIIDASSADDNAAFMRLAERLIQQQDAAVPSPAAIRASLPKQGRLLTFRRTVQVDTWADLKIGLEASAKQAASFSVKLLILIATFAVLSLLLWTTTRLRTATVSLVVSFLAIGVYASAPNPVLVGSWPGFPRGHAHSVAVQGNQAYLATDHGGLAVIDISDSANPTRLGGHDTAGRALGVDVTGGYAFVADDRAGLQIFSVTNPASPVWVGSYDTGGNALCVQVVGTYAYVADGRGGFQIIDVSDPTNPASVGGYGTGGYTVALQVAGHYAYLADNENGLHIINISTASNPSRVGQYYFGTDGDPINIQVIGHLAYLACGNFTKIFDVSDPVAPRIVLNAELEGSSSDGQGAYVYIPNFKGGLRVVDVSNPDSPALAATADTFGESFDVQVVGAYAYLADGQGGMRILDVSDPLSATPVGSYGSSGQASAVQVLNGYAYIADYDGGLQVVDVSDPIRPTRVGGCDTRGLAVGLDVSEDYAYVADSTNGLQIIDVSDPATPIIVAGYEPPRHAGYARDVQVVDGYAYLAAGESLQIINVADPANPFRVAIHYTGDVDTALNVQVLGDYAYVSDGSTGLIIVDIRDPVNPVRAGSYDTFGPSWGLHVADDYAYVTDFDGLQIIDVHNPATPLRIGGFNTKRDAVGVHVAGIYGYVANGTNGLQIIDVSTPASPVLVGQYNANGFAWAVQVVSPYVYVADRRAGLLILRHSPPPRLEVLGINTAVFRIQVSGPSGAEAQIQRSTNLIDWLNLGERFTFGDTPSVVSDPTGTHERQQFYRALMQ